MGRTQAIETVVTATQAPSAGQLIEGWRGDLDVRPKTKDGYERAMRSFVAWMDARGLALTDATRADLIAYRDWLKENYAAPTVSAYLVPVRSLYRWMAGITHTPSIAEGIKGPKAGRAHAKDALTKDQARRSVAVAEGRAEGGDLAALRDAAIYELLLVDGLRTIEAVRADVGDLRTIAGQRVLYVQGKGHDAKDAPVKLTGSVCRSIDRYLAARGNPRSDEPLFCGHCNRNRGERLTTRTVRGICKRTMGDAGISSPRLTAHSLRHTAITAAILGGSDLLEVQRMARHEDPKTTMIYIHEIDGMESHAVDYADAYAFGGEATGERA